MPTDASARRPRRLKTFVWISIEIGESYAGMVTVVASDEAEARRLLADYDQGAALALKEVEPEVAAEPGVWMVWGGG